jgi:glycosyltransferase involved in cell wall biosynthesis
MRIVHVITKGDVGGAQTAVVELASTQAAHGDDAVVVVAGSDGPALERLRRAGVTTEVVPALSMAWSGGSLRRAYLDLRSCLRSLRPDVVHGHSSHGGLLSRASARSLSIPSVYTAHGWPFQTGAPLRQRVSSYLGEAAGAQLGDAVICLTRSEADAARFVVPRRRIRIVPNGIADVAPSCVRPTRSRGGAPTRLIMVARFAPPKRQLALIESLTSATRDDWTLTFVGDGPEREVCERVASDRFGDGRIVFAGHSDGVPELLAAHDVAILWSGYEGMPMALLEGMRAGLCCVANDLPGVRVLFGAEPAAGVIVADGDDLARTVDRLCAEPAEVDRLGSLARARYEAAFTADAVATATRRVYDEVVGRGRFNGRRRGRDGGTSAR